jgi:phosphocarrier protein
MMLGAAKGDTIEIEVEGEQAETRLAELVALVVSGFGED